MLVQKFKDDIRKKELRMQQEEEERRKEQKILDIRLGDFKGSKKKNNTAPPSRNGTRGQQVRTVSQQPRQSRFENSKSTKTVSPQKSKLEVDDDELFQNQLVEPTLKMNEYGIAVESQQITPKRGEYDRLSEEANPGSTEIRRKVQILNQLAQNESQQSQSHGTTSDQKNTSSRANCDLRGIFKHDEGNPKIRVKPHLNPYMVIKKQLNSKNKNSPY